MRKSILIYLFLLISASLRGQSLNQYDLNAPFGWAVCSSETSGAGYSLTGGGTSAPYILKSNGSDMREAIQQAIRNHPVVVLDGSNGDFIVSPSGVLVSSDSMSENKTVVGINGATIRSQYQLTDGMRAALTERKSEIQKGQGEGYVYCKKYGYLKSKRVSESDERFTRGILIDYTGDTLETYRNWGVWRINGGGKNCNLIIRNITFIGPGSVDLGAADCFGLNDVKHIWIDHCHFQDGLDGNLDITGGSDFLTVSWCTFSYGPNSWSHKFSNLINGGSASRLVKITYAYCVWGGGVYSRTPMGGYSKVHMLNCLYDAPGNGDRVNPRAGGNYLLEGCYFAPGRGYLKDQGSDSGAQGGICCKENLFANGEKPVNSVSLTMPYNYTAMPAAKVPEILSGANGAGPTLAEPLVIGR